MLLQKIKSAGMNRHNIISNWLFSYLFNREQFVVLYGRESPSTPVLSGVPQGSVLGPLLFLMYINDVAVQLNNGSFINLYADDMLLYRDIGCPEDYNILQSDVNTIFTWVDRNNLLFNESKCKYMIISRLKSNSVAASSLTLHSQQIEKVSSYKYLGITITDNLSWSTHINQITSNARKIIASFTVSFSLGPLNQPYSSFIHH